MRLNIIGKGAANLEGIYDWVRNLVFYLILMTMVMNLLPDKKYEKYLRLFTGMIFILIVFQPFMRIGGLEERMAGAFEKITFQNDAKLLKRELEEADGERMKRLADGYRRAVEEDIRNMTAGTGVTCKSLQVTIEDDIGSGEFGSLRAVSMQATVAQNGSGQYEDKWMQGSGDELSGRESMTERRIKANREIGLLKTRIGEYYGLEEGKIQIQLENE